MILFKVIGPQRCSIFATGRYLKFYYPDTIVTSEPQTHGLMCFWELEHAKDFILKFGLRGCQIIRVLAVRRTTCIDSACTNTSEFVLDNYYSGVKSKLTRKSPVPHGTICCRTIRVLE